MLNDLDLSTIRAALRYWLDEMSPHGPPAMSPYFGTETFQPLSGSEVKQLIDKLGSATLCYAHYDPAADQLASTALSATPSLPSVPAPLQVVAVLRP